MILAREDDSRARRVAVTLDRAVGNSIPVRLWSHPALLLRGAADTWTPRLGHRYDCSIRPSRPIVHLLEPFEGGHETHTANVGYTRTPAPVKGLHPISPHECVCGNCRFQIHGQGGFHIDRVQADLEVTPPTRGALRCGE